MVLPNGTFMTAKYCAPCTVLGSRAKKTPHHHQLFLTKEPILLHKSEKQKSFFPHPLPFNRCPSYVSFQELFPEKLAVAVSLISTYSNKSLTRTSPSHICNNQLNSMQNAVCTTILSPTVAQRLPSSGIILFSLLL